MSNQTFATVQQNTANTNALSRGPKTGFYVPTTGHGFNAATTDIIRVEPRTRRGA